MIYWNKSEEIFQEFYDLSSRDSVCKRLENCLLDDDYDVICEMYGLK